ncbi:acyltransferase [Isoptericola sp. NEAU-Y5]|uniref:Acyltransferase n=1 Tax=Isoptericola luteus TaxID=2879484 RepID=A0ABS7ZFU5_9MICO|nr:acyltransferase [Isoptericola sp. NEAU-Y5]MCA5893895.1 acyltransferase [Isoptericola sp. NEAU-Y5]
MSAPLVSTPGRGTTAGRLDAIVDATPTSRDRVVDLVRAVSICVVVVWHWTLSVTHWTADGALTMPNPIHAVPGGWAVTWVLQVMPVFFLVGGYANLAGFQATVRDGGGPARCVGRRMRRLLLPVLPFLALWAMVDVAMQATGRPSVLHWGMVVFVPLWFLGVYAAVVAAVPITARLHARWGWLVPTVLAGVALAADALRLGAGLGNPVVWVIGSTAVWLFCHQLGYFWRDGTLLAGGRRRAAAVAAGGFVALTLLTTLGPYPRSMVAVQGDPVGNMFPTTAAVAALAMFQLGLVLLGRPRLQSWLRRRRPWRAVVAANAVAMPVFVWHMTALVAFLWLYGLAGFTPADEATAAWWLSRPVWIVGPGLVLAGILAVVAGPYGRARGERRPRAAHGTSREP